VNGDVKNINVPKEYIHIVMGEGRKILEDIETKTGTKIRVLFPQNAEGRLQHFVCILLDLECYCSFGGKFPKLSCCWPSALNIFLANCKICFCSPFWFK
jgi:hypothetical protein